MSETTSNEDRQDFSHADIGIVSALPMELAPFLDRCDRVRKYSGGHFTFRGGLYDEARIVVVAGAVDFAKARRATQTLVEAHSPSWVLASGFAGALRPELEIGDIVMADSIVDPHGQELTVDLTMSAEGRKGLHVGRLITTDEIVRTVREKQALAEKYNALAVDTESLAVAQVCRESRTRFMAVRTVSDDLSADLPPEILSIYGATGSMRLGAALGAAWKRPGSVKDMWKLRESARQAAERLAAFLDGVILQLYESIR